MSYFLARFNPDGSLSDQRKAGTGWGTLEEFLAQGYEPVPIPHGRAYNSWDSFHRDTGFTWPAWERDWGAFRDQMTATPEFLSVDKAAETNTRLSHRISGMSTAISNLVKEGATPEEFNRFLYQWGQFKSALAEEPIAGYTGEQILGKISIIAELLRIDLNHVGIKLS